MYFFHGSKMKIQVLKINQEIASPENKRERADSRGYIYLSPSREVALFYAAKPERGRNRLSAKKRLVYFERKIHGYCYIHTVYTENFTIVNEYEVMVEEEIPVLKIERVAAADIFKYFVRARTNREFEKLKNSLK